MTYFEIVRYAACAIGRERNLVFPEFTAVRALGNEWLAADMDLAELPATAFQRALDIYGACFTGRFAVGAQTLDEFVSEQRNEGDPEAYLDWLQATAEDEGADDWYIFWADLVQEQEVSS